MKITGTAKRSTDAVEPPSRTSPVLVTANCRVRPIGRTTRAVMALADKHRLTSIALPALGTGVGHVPAQAAADAMLTAVVTHLKSAKTTVKRIVFVLYQDDALRAFTDTLKRLAAIQ